MNEYERDLPKLTHSVTAAPKWRARWQIALVGTPIGATVNTALWWIGLYSGPWWHSAGLAAVVWLAVAGACRLAERWHIRRINRIMAAAGGWRVTRVTTSRPRIPLPKGQR